MAIAITASTLVALSGNTGKLSYTGGSATLGASAYYATTNAGTATTETVKTTTATYTRCGGTTTGATGTIYLSKLPVNVTSYIYVISNDTSAETLAENAASGYITTYKVIDTVPGDSTKNLLGSTASAVAYTSQTETINITPGAYTTVLVLQTSARVTDAVVANWIGTDITDIWTGEITSSGGTSPAFQIVADTNTVAPTITGLTPSLRISAGITYGTN